MSDVSAGSAVFAAYRPLGYVSNHVPCIVRYIKRRKEHLIVTVTGRSFHVYGSNKLGILSVSKQHPEDITALAGNSQVVFTAAGENIYIWNRGSELTGVLEGHRSPVHILLPFAHKLISVDSQSFLKVWDTKSQTEELELTFNKDKFEITAVCHPSTYLDKILVGSRQGPLHLWNLKTTKLIYSFEGWGSGVSGLEQAPALDVVAIGLQSGDIYLHNLKYDETVVHFKQDWGPVTGIAFRTDGPPVMLTGSSTGHVAVWNLEERKLSSQMRHAHSGEHGGVAGLCCLPSEPLMITSSGDNTVKMWIFDMPDGGARLLRHREGHAAPPSKIRFYGSSGANILSAGQDSSLRIFSTVTDILNRSLGHASYNRKKSKRHKVTEDPARMPPILDFTIETTREMEWDNIGSIHRGLSTTTTWSWGKSKMGELKLKHERFKTDLTLKTAKATCLTLSACGNFIIIGYSSGHIDRYNIQSGLYRGEYKHGEKPAHKNPIRGVASDALNQMVISADSRGIIKFWHFKSLALITKVVLKSEISSLNLHRDSNLLACALETFDIVLIDIDTREVARRFTDGHSAAITDMTFSHDGRWLVSASLDSTARVWDLPTGHCIDYISFPSPVTSVDFSPAGDLLATSHVEDLGIYLWCNKSLYQHLNLKALPKNAEPKLLCLPRDLVLEGAQKDKEEEENVVKMDAEDEFVSPDQLSQDLITLANLPTSRWLNLLNLDVIKAKNKPKAPPKKPKAAPFFLPTVPGLEPQFLLEKVVGEEADRFLSNISDLTEFGKALGQAESEQDFEAMYKSFLEKGPSAIDIEIRALAPEGGGSIALMEQFLTLLNTQLKKKINFETVNAHLGLFLQVHGETIVSSPDLRSNLTSVQDNLATSWTHLQADLDTALCLANFCKSSFL
jgi:U3 small nucleolar RNA-associated protein 21